MDADPERKRYLAIENVMALTGRARSTIQKGMSYQPALNIQIAQFFNSRFDRTCRLLDQTSFKRDTPDGFPKVLTTHDSAARQDQNEQNEAAMLRRFGSRLRCPHRTPCLCRSQAIFGVERYPKSTLAKRRRTGDSPPFMKLGKSIWYPVRAGLDWLRGPRTPVDSHAGKTTPVSLLQSKQM